MFLPRNFLRSARGFAKCTLCPAQINNFSILTIFVLNISGTASQLSKEKTQIDEKIKKNISQKISLLQFKSLKEV